MFPVIGSRSQSSAAAADMILQQSRRQDKIVKMA
jgi:hypothetical protein